MAKKGVVKSSSSSGSSESNTGLIVTLVVFILLALGLGVTTYFGYAGQEDLRKAASDANNKAKAAEAKARDEEAQKLALRLASGLGDDTDKTAFSGIKSSANTAVSAQIAKFNDRFAVLARELAKDEQLAGIYPKIKELAAAKWDSAGNDTPPKSYLGLLDEVTKAFKAQVARQQAERVAADEERKRLTDEIQNLQGSLQKAQAAIKEANDKVVAEQNKKSEAFESGSAQIKKLSEQVQQVTNEKQNLDAEKTAEIERLKAKLDSQNKMRDQFKSRVGPILENLEKIKISRPEIRELADLHELLLKQFETVQSLSNDASKGSIVKIDRATGLVYVNLGSADYIRPGITFSVLPAGATGRTAAARERKGAIEIVTVLEPHLSTATVVDATNPVRDPLLPGDLLFNAAWNPTQREHVAIAGIIDINGDGIDDTQDLIRALERQGVVVDAWLDLKERAIKGPGITEKTTYLLVGEKPILPPNVQLENNPLSQAALDIIGRMEEMHKKTKDLGGLPVAYRRFLTQIGYKLPKVPENNPVSASTYLRGLTPKNAPKGGTTQSDLPK